MTLDLSLVAAFLQVAMIDLVLASDNAVVIGLAVAGLPAAQRARAILVGIIAATALRIFFALITVQLLRLDGLMLAGGFLLLWVCWNMWRELRRRAEPDREAAGNDGSGAAGDGAAAGTVGAAPPAKSLRRAVTQIVIADVSMSLDNVLAVAGAARDHLAALVLGLVLSVALMGLASAFIARLLTRYRWIAYLGLAVILLVALRMIHEGAGQVLDGGLPIPFPERS
ncbi:TerC family protein [Amaricoccus sp. W119]|uniref:TerC family protein n=1 Tax=Amaricoccus sp. W119 TaxID=3391833 RepID=UPI0039A5DBDC